MKRGIFVQELKLDPSKPPVFDIDVQAGRLVQIYGSAEPVSELEVAGKQRMRLVPVFCFDVDFDEPTVTRRFVLMPVIPGEAVGIEGDDGRLAEFVGMFINPLNKLPLAVYELPWSAETSIADSSEEVTPDSMLETLTRAREEKTP